MNAAAGFSSSPYSHGDNTESSDMQCELHLTHKERVDSAFWRFGTLLPSLASRHLTLCRPSGEHGGGYRCWGFLQWGTWRGAQVLGNLTHRGGHRSWGGGGGGGGGGCLRLFEWYLQVFVVQSFQCRYSLLGVVGQEPV